MDEWIDGWMDGIQFLADFVCVYCDITWVCVCVCVDSLLASWTVRERLTMDWLPVCVCVSVCGVHCTSTNDGIATLFAAVMQGINCTIDAQLR